MCYTLLNFIPEVFRIDQEEIQIVKEVNDLGITFDHKLSFRSHIYKIILNMKKKLGIVSRNLYYLPTLKIRKLIFHNFFLLLVNYGLPVWASAMATHLNQLNRVLSKTKKILFNHFICRNDVNVTDILTSIYKREFSILMQNFYIILYITQLMNQTYF